MPRARLWSCCVFLLLTLTRLASAADSPPDLAAKFLEGLRQRGWNDVAIEYLDHAADDPLATDEFLDRIDYERAVTQASQAKNSVDEKQRLFLLAQATTRFQKFAKSHRDSPYAVESLGHAGKLLTEQALLLLAQADRLPARAQNDRKQLKQTARTTFSEATATVETLLESCQRELDSLPKGVALQNDPESRATRQRLQTRQAEARFLSANLLFETARTYARRSEDSKKNLAQASNAFAKLSKDYDRKLVGYFGLLYQGRCDQEAGKFKAALESYDTLVSQPSRNAEFRILMSRAYRRRAECLRELGRYDQAIGECRDWLSDARGEERRKPEWLAVAFRLAEVYEAKLKDPETQGETGRLRADARKLYRDIAKHGGEFQSAARTALASTGTKIQKVAANSFGEAFAAGKEALEQMNSSKLAAKLAKDNNPEAVEDLQSQAEQNQKAARGYFQKSLRLVDEETPLEDLLAARYYLCWLCWEEGRLNDAAVLGDFVARRYSESKYAPVAARLALAAYEKLLNQAKQADDSGGHQFETEQLTNIAQLIITRWPDSTDASTAMNLLINLALGQGRHADAEQLLEKLPAERRAAAELSLGGSMWNRYLRLTSNQSGAAAKDKDIAQWKKRASDLLTSGYEHLQEKAKPSVAETTGVLYFVQLLLSQGEFDQAVRVLEDPKVGPLTLVKKNNRRQRPEFVSETYKAALRAYVSVDPPRRDQAQQMMEALEAAVSDQPDAQRRLTNIYVSLGLQLQRQIKELSAAGKKETARAVAASFEDLLKRVTQRSDGNDWKIRNWIAQTNLQLGEGLEGEDAARYLSQAESIYREMLAEAKKETNTAPNAMAVLGVKKRLGDCLQAQEKFSEAFEQYTQILAEKPNMLELQQATAMALQKWGATQKEEVKLEQAILGTQPQKDKKNLVWGWLRLAKVADFAQKKSASKSPNSSQVAKYRDIYFAARYNAAKARFLASQIAGGAEGKKHQQTARRSVLSMKRLYPDLGGPRWKQKFNQLLQQIETQSKK